MDGEFDTDKCIVDGISGEDAKNRDLPSFESSRRNDIGLEVDVVGRIVVQIAHVKCCGMLENVHTRQSHSSEL